MIRVEIGKVVEASEGLVDGGVVLHRAGAQGIETLVQVEVETAEAAEMPGDLRLAERCDREWRLTPQSGGHQLIDRSRLDTGGGQSRARTVRAAQLEEQRLAHASASRNRSIARGWLSSVTEMSNASDNSGKNRPRGKPGRTPRSSMKAWVCSPRSGVGITNSHRNGPSKASRYPFRSTSCAAR